MRRTALHYVMAVALGVSAGAVAHAASFDLNRAFDAVKGLTTAATDVDEKQEIAIGRELAGTVLGAAPLVNDPALQSYVNKVGRWIASQSERPDLPWRFGVIETPGINAFAAPGGYILVTRGLYEILENESQLAGVLGHEIAHVLKRHHVTAMQKQGALQGVASLGQAAVGSRGRLGGAVGEQIVAAGRELFTKGIDKEYEYEADHLGVVLVARAGYAPYGLVNVMHKLQARAGEASMALLFSTHPHPSDRLAKLGEAMTPRIDTLPEGLEPQLRTVSASPPASQSRAARPPAGVRGMQDEPDASPAAATEPAPRGGNPLGHRSRQPSPRADGSLKPRC